MDSSPPNNVNKHPAAASDDDGPPPKRLKPLIGIAEVPALYSEQVKKKLAATSRTGQACDRCKERKMKCDTDPIACQPCRSKQLRCFTTDRVTGQARERGQSDRTENELAYLQNQLQMYRQKYGPLGPDTRAAPSYPSSELASSSSSHIPSSRYVGWPAPNDTEPIQRGPVYATTVNILDAFVDIADFDCDQMREPAAGQHNVFNASRTSIIRTLFQFQSVSKPDFPKKEEALQSAEHFLVIMSQYVPIVHRPSFKEMIARFYDSPSSITTPELMQFVVMLAILSQQSATRNHQVSDEEFKKAHHYLHYALGFYRDVYADTTLPAMQALAFLCVYFRNLPKPGITWSFCHQILVRGIELQYHRDPDQITLPPSENNELAKQLRIRVFHSVIVMCVTTGCRVGLPAPWQFQHVDVPLPAVLKDDEISVDGIAPNRSGSCDYYPCLQLSKLLPLLTELYNHIISVRRPPNDYLKTVDALNTKIMAWRQDWDTTVKNEPRTPQVEVATLLMDQWMAEFQLTLHHPVCCTSTSPEILDRNLDMCHAAAKRLLQSFHKLNQKYKGADFTWHSVIAYAMAFGVTLHVYRKRLGKISKEKFESLCNELSGWISLTGYADLVLRTGNLLQNVFRPRKLSLEEDYRKLLDVPTPQAPSHPTFQPVNGVLPRPNVKAEPSPIPQQLNGVPQPQQMLPPMPPIQTTGSQYNTGPPPTTSSPWTQQPPSPMSYPSSSSMSPSYSPYAQSAPPAGSFPRQIPVSLAPLLNNPTSMFASYPAPSQAQTHTVGPTAADYSMMAFHPNHYYESSWPMINMPGQDGQQ